VELKSILGFFAVLLAVGSAVLALIYYFRTRSQPNVRSMMDSYTRGEGGSVAQIRKRLEEDKTGATYEMIKEQTKRRETVKKRNLSLEEKLFQAGMFTGDERREFVRLRLIAPIVAVPLSVGVLWYFAGATMGLIGILLGGAIGYQLPISIVERRIKKRHDDIMFYLPLVIEQISIGVSSSLDIGPCLARVISMADERDSHNAVTELIRYAQNYIKSGVSFEDAMVETGKASGHTELKHAFMFLAQVAKHGGEITRQLQELADSVSNQRQTHIEGKIKKLEVAATGPVGLVFLAFMVMLLTSFGLQLKNAF
jgi:Flp pilus assembly protein TadB